MEGSRKEGSKETAQGWCINQATATRSGGSRVRESEFVIASALPSTALGVDRVVQDVKGGRGRTAPGPGPEQPA